MSIFSVGNVIGLFITWIVGLWRRCLWIIPESMTVQVTVLTHTTFVVIEMDLPWDNRQIEEYGESFRAWEETTFKQAVDAIWTSMPHAKPVLVVSCHLFTYF